MMDDDERISLTTESTTDSTIRQELRRLARCSRCLQLWGECGCDDDDRFPEFVAGDAGSIGETDG